MKKESEKTKSHAELDKKQLEVEHARRRRRLMAEYKLRLECEKVGRELRKRRIQALAKGPESFKEYMEAEKLELKRFHELMRKKLQPTKAEIAGMYRESKARRERILRFWPPECSDVKKYPPYPFSIPEYSSFAVPPTEADTRRPSVPIAVPHPEIFVPLYPMKVHPIGDRKNKVEIWAEKTTEPLTDRSGYEETPYKLCGEYYMEQGSCQFIPGSDGDGLGSMANCRFSAATFPHLPCPAKLDFDAHMEFDVPERDELALVECIPELAISGSADFHGNPESSEMKVWIEATAWQDGNRIDCAESVLQIIERPVVTDFMPIELWPISMPSFWVLAEPNPFRVRITLKAELFVTPTDGEYNYADFGFALLTIKRIYTFG